MIETDDQTSMTELESNEEQPSTIDDVSSLIEEGSSTHAESANDQIDAQQVSNESESVDSDLMAENSGEPGAKKAEESETATISNEEPKWRQEIKRFHDVINGLLATKENFKLVAVDQKLKSAYGRNWRNESNRFFQLAVQIRRRASGSKLSGKTIV